MAFQFLCPQGHVLQGDPSQVGQQCKCPHCGSLFLVPPNVPGPQAGPAPVADRTPAKPPAVGEMPVEPPAPPPGVSGPASDFPGIRTGIEFEGMVEPAGPSELRLPGRPDGGLYHVLCPNGHELETPREMFGQDAVCPLCRTQFHLCLEASREYQVEQAEKLAREERRLGRLWLNWAIAAAIAVILGVIFLIVAIHS